MQRASNADFVPGRDLSGDLGLMAGLVRQHRRADDVADRENMRHVGAHLLVDVDDDRARLPRRPPRLH